MTQDAVPRPKNKLGIVALVLALLAAVTPLVIVIIVWIVGVTEYPDEISMWRPGSKAPGIVAIIIGVIGSLGLFGFPFVLGEIVPGF
jgi:hypothetical protein